MNMKLGVVHDFDINNIRCTGATIALSENGEIYIYNNSRIRVFQSHGTCLRSWPIHFVINMLIRDSKLYAIIPYDEGYEMQIFTLDGSLLRRWDLFFLTNTLWYYIHLTSSKEEIYISYYRNQKFIICVLDLNGLVQREILISGIIRSIAFGNGELYVRKINDTSLANEVKNEVIVVHPEGYVLRSWIISNIDDTIGEALTVSHGFIFAPSDDTMQIFSPSGDLLWKDDLPCSIQRILIQGEYILAAHSGRSVRGGVISLPSLQLWQIKNISSN